MTFTIFLLLTISLCLGGVFLLFFIRAAKEGQFDDLETPAHRILLEDQMKIPTDKTDNLTKKRNGL